MHEAKEAMRLEEELKPIGELCKKMTEMLAYDVENNRDKISTQDVGAVTDMIKDLCEAKEKMAKACYYKSIVAAMEEEGGEGRRGFMPDIYDRMYPDRDMDMRNGRMYYSSGGSLGGTGNGRGGNGGNRGGRRSGYEESYSNESTDGAEGTRPSGMRYGFSFDEYLEKREEYSGNDPENRRKRMKLLNDFMDDFVEMAEQVVDGMTPEEKQAWKSKINRLINM